MTEWLNWTDLILCLPLLLFLLPWIFPSIGVFSNESTLHIRWPKYWSFSFIINPSKNIQDWFPLGLTDLISLQSRGLSRIFSNTTVQKHNFFGAQPSLLSNSHINTWLLEKPWLWLKDVCWQSVPLCVSVIINFTYLLDCTMLYPDIWPNIHYSECSSECFGKQLTFQSVDWVKQISLHNMGEAYLIKLRPEYNKKAIVVQSLS